MILKKKHNNDNNNNNDNDNNKNDQNDDKYNKNVIIGKPSTPLEVPQGLEVDRWHPPAFAS